MVRAWVLRVERPGRGWAASRLDDVRDAEAVIAGVERRDGREGTRLAVELERVDGTRVTASDRVVRGGCWVDASEALAS